jgi:hypothetical protein
LRERFFPTMRDGMLWGGAPVIASALTSWLAAVGTCGAVLVALFLQLLMPYRRRPKLVILNEAVPEATTDTDGDGIEGQWWDISVENKGRRDAAVGAQVMLTGVLLPEVTEHRVPLRSLKWTHLENAQTEIPAGITRSVELGRIKPKGTGRLRLGIFPPLEHSSRTELGPGRYSFEIALVAENVRARHYVVDFVLDDHGALSFPRGIIPRRKPTASP